MRGGLTRRLALKTLTLMGAAVGLTTTPLPAQAATEPVAEVLRVKGAVMVNRGGGDSRLTGGDRLGADDVVMTGPDGRAQIRLIDGTVLTLAPGSGYRVSEFAHDPTTGQRSVRIAPLAGLIQATVAKAAPGSKFEVELAFSVASVRGTEFMFELQSDRCVVFVREGEVAVLHKNPVHHHRHIVMRAGEGTFVTPDAPPAYAARWSDELASKWSERVSFE